MEKLQLDRPLVVEGKYDKNTLRQICDGVVVSTGGFGVFKSQELVTYLKKLAEPKGLLVLTDSDSGGQQIRRYLSSVLPKEKVTHLYIPQIEGKEKRKDKRSKQGFLGVEGMDANLLKDILRPFATDAQPAHHLSLTKLDFYRLGLSGGENSAEKRQKLAIYLGFPRNMTANALLEAVNTLLTEEQWQIALQIAFSNKPSLAREGGTSKASDG